jgi:NADH-quinone oxidoreductase subunit J
MTITPEAMTTVLFYGLGAVIVAFALAVVRARKLLRAAIYLMGVLFMSAGLYLLLGAPFLAGIQVLVYVGGIVVLIVFAVMLTHSEQLQMDNPPALRKVLGFLAAAGFLVLTIGVFQVTDFAAIRAGYPPTDSTKAIGHGLLGFGADGYVLPFEIISLLLLAAAIGGIVIARKVPPPGQPFTSGGDFSGEADLVRPRSQADAPGPQDDRSGACCAMPRKGGDL